METLLMSGKERKRLVVMEQVGKEKMTLAQGARVMDLSYRQAKRVWARYQKKGDGGLVHRGRGKPGPRRKSGKFRAQVLARYRKRYADFGPTLAAEHLREDGFSLDHETLRRWLLEKQLWAPGRPRRQHRAWRERRECFGQMVQLDGSHHDWFEGRREKAVLMVMVDDATNITHAQFFEGETTRASFDVFEGWVGAHGLPGSLYVDRDSIYRCERVASVAEQIAGKEPRTQFGRAMEELGVEIIMAHSPQAKGRVERRNGLLQDRLVKELRLAGISDLEEGNRFLIEKFLPALNKKFTVKARSPADAHRWAPATLAQTLSWQEERVVGQDWTVAWEGRWFQIQREHEGLNLAGRKILVRHLRSGAVELLRENRALKSKELPARPEPVQKKKEPPAGGVRLSKPIGEHPWRKDHIGHGRPFWKKKKADEMIRKRAAHQAAASSGQPPLRSGFPMAAAA
jgi:molybdenum-dependent DNA-binding transcriptional regulator ModE